MVLHRLIQKGDQCVVWCILILGGLFKVILGVLLSHFGITLAALEREKDAVECKLRTDGLSHHFGFK